MWHHDLMWRYENEICDETGIFSDITGVWICGWGAKQDCEEAQEAEGRELWKASPEASSEAGGESLGASFEVEG